MGAESNYVMRMIDNGKIGIMCPDVEITNGLILSSSSIMTGQISCTPHVGNAGNLYSYIPLTDGSVCPKNWILPHDEGTYSFEILLSKYYGLWSNDNENTSKNSGGIIVSEMPISYIYGGIVVGGSFSERGSRGYYRSSRLNGNNSTYYANFGTDEKLSFHFFNTGTGYYGGAKTNGFSLRCGEEWRVLQKESLGEYGSGWGWDNDEPELFAFDQEDSDGIPLRYLAGKQIAVCDNIDNTYGQLLHSNSIMTHQKSCVPNVENAGNWYGRPNISSNNSICPSNWKVPSNTELERGGYSSLFSVYQMEFSSKNSQASSLQPPFSYVLTGEYCSKADNTYILQRGINYNYFTSKPKYRLFYVMTNTGQVFLYSNYQYTTGNSLRCVAR